MPSTRLWSAPSQPQRPSHSRRLRTRRTSMPPTFSLASLSGRSPSVVAKKHRSARDIRSSRAASAWLKYCRCRFAGRPTIPVSTRAKAGPCSQETICRFAGWEGMARTHARSVVATETIEQYAQTRTCHAADDRQSYMRLEGGIGAPPLVLRRRSEVDPCFCRSSSPRKRASDGASLSRTASTLTGGNSVGSPDWACAVGIACNRQTPSRTSRLCSCLAPLATNRPRARHATSEHPISIAVPYLRSAAGSVTKPIFLKPAVCACDITRAMTSYRVSRSARK
jgi:hypothetical protein